MKLTAIMLILSLLLPLCASCAPTGNSDNNTDGGGTAASAPDDSIRDENGFTIFSEGNYLADQKFETDEFLPDYDADNDFITLLTGVRELGICTTDDTIYYAKEISGINGGLSHILIMLYDKATGISLPLCGKPECLHDDKNCNAYVEDTHLNFFSGPYIYDNKLYYSLKTSIWRMNLDGTAREQLRTFSYDVFGNGISGYPNAVLHRGYMYYSIPHNSVISGQAMSGVAVWAVALDGDEEFKILETETNSNCWLRFIGNDVYMMNMTSEWDDEGKIHQTLEFYLWNSETRQGEEIFKYIPEAEGEGIWGRNFRIVPGDGIYFPITLFKRTEDGTIEYDCNGIRKYSFESRCVEHAFWTYIDDMQGIDASFSSNFVSTRPGPNSILVQDYTGELIFYSGELTGHVVRECIGADDQYVYHTAGENGFEYILAIPIDGGEPIVLD